MNEALLKAARKAASRLNFKFPYSVEEWIENGLKMENYHKHTTWSNICQIDSATSIQEFMAATKERGSQCLFSGEHGWQGEWIYVYDECKHTLQSDYPIKFRYSTEAYWVKNRSEDDNTNCHIVIVARNYNAIRKVNYILSEANVSGFYYKPRIDLDLLFTLDKDDVYVTSACVAGWKYEDATDIWLRIWEHFGDSFFLEYQAHNTQRQKDLNAKIYELSKTYGIQTIVGLDTHYLNEEDRVKRDDLLVRKGIRYDDEEGWFMDWPTGWTVYDRMIKQRVLPVDEVFYAMMNTQVFIEGCEDIKLDEGFKIPILDKYLGMSYQERVEELKKILYQKYSEEQIQSDERAAGIEYELGQISESETADYFLDDYEIIKLATSEKYGGQLTTTSRGSASSYYTSKLLGFTTMDRFEAEVPIYPERFITKERIKASHQMPDVDLNCAAQEPFLQASRELLGEHGCYPLLAVGKFGEKSGFKLYASVKGIEPAIANEITTAIDAYNNALKDVEDDSDRAFIDIEDYITNKEHLKIFYDSKPYQGIIEQGKVHACGHALFNGNPRQKDVVGYGDIRYEIGLIRCHSESSEKSTIVACVEGGLLDYYGYVKNDYLIVDVVGIIYKLYHALGREVPTVRELRRMVTGDQMVWNLYARGITCCLNQCEKESTTKKVMIYKPQTIRELSAFIAGIRPGFKSLINGFLSRVEYSNGEPAIDELLADSFGYMLYQEATMRIYVYLGIPMKDAYDTIKKISKKKLKGDALIAVENSLRGHWFEKIGNLDNFDAVYKVVKDSGQYSFNAPHALAMANDSLYEAWVKGHYPAVFYEVTLNHYQAKGDKGKVHDLQKEAMEFFGYKMDNYEYGKDNSKFVVAEDSHTISPNLSSIKGIGVNAMKDMWEIYQSGVDDFVDIRNAIKGTQVDVSVFKKLVDIGYFRRFGTVKKLTKILEIYDRWSGSSGKGLKTVSKAKIAELNLGNVDITKYATDVLPSGKISLKQYSNLDWIGLVKALAKEIPDEEYGIAKLLKLQYDVLGYLEYVNPDIDARYCFVTEMDTKYSPRFVGYCLKTGQKKEFKIHKKKNRKDQRLKVSYEQCSIEDGDLIYIRDFKKEAKRRKVDNDWVTIDGEFDTWLKDYTKIQVV